MFLRLLLSFLILYEIPAFINGHEYLKDLQPKEIKLSNEDDLPQVEIPRPIFDQRSGRSEFFEFSDDVGENDTRQQISQRPTLMDIALESSAREGLNAMRRLYAILEPDMLKNGHILHENHPGALLSMFSAPRVESSRREMAAYATLTAAKVFRKNFNLNSDLARQAHSQKVSLRRTSLESLCPPREAPTCMPASERYRTHDGTCNNKRRQRWGAAQMPFSRFLPPEYGDGVDSVRKSVDGGPLSSSRFVSLLVHGARDGEAPLTLMLAQWGQLLDHDLTSTAQPRSINGSVPSCCGNKDFHPSCFPIKVPLDDPWLSSLKVRCLEFLRSAPAQRRDCILSWREQTNQATSFIDASPIYSNSVKSSDNARTFRNGLLIFGRGNPSDDVCQRGAIATNCIRSGDGRSGEQPGLLALHHVWVGEHNHIAMRLSEMNLHWSDEKIYQETRRIIGAMFQHITYREFLPIVLGREVVKLFDLELLTSGYYERYDPKTNPGVANAFAAAAFRFGHSLVQNSYMRCDRFHNVLNNNVSLHEEFQRGDIGSVGSLHRLIRGLANQRALQRDEFITPELTNHLFQTPGFPFGLDLAAINIQRGRDHGIPPYTHWRVPCGLSPINTWEEFASVVGPESARRISHAYQNVHDIDLFVGGIAERPVVGGLVGPTFACIIAQQFSNSRKGDRFWYENAGFESSFTPAQLHSIRRVTLASVLCRSVGGGTFQPHIFLPPDMPQNERLPCGVGSLSEFDLDPWLEQDPFANPKPAPLQLATPAPIQIQTRPTHSPPALPQPPRTPLAPSQQLRPSLAQPQPPLPPLALPQPPLPPPEKPPQLPSSAPPLPTFDPPVLDRIFEIVHGELETNAPIPEDFLASNKVGFLNRHPPATKHPLFIPQISSNGFNRFKNSSKINDKLDLKHKGGTGHVTKQKPLPGVNNKLDKNSRKGSHRHGSTQTTTRRTIIVNNIPIELRNAALNDVREGVTTVKTDDKLESRTEDLALTTDISLVERLNDNLDNNDVILEARTEDQEIAETEIKSDHISLTNDKSKTDNELERREEKAPINIDKNSDVSKINNEGMTEEIGLELESREENDPINLDRNDDRSNTNNEEMTEKIGHELEAREENDPTTTDRNDDRLKTNNVDMTEKIGLELDFRDANDQINILNTSNGSKTNNDEVIGLELEPKENIDLVNIDRHDDSSVTEFAYMDKNNGLDNNLKNIAQNDNRSKISNEVLAKKTGITEATGTETEKYDLFDILNIEDIEVKAKHNNFEKRDEYQQTLEDCSKTQTEGPVDDGSTTVTESHPFNLIEVLGLNKNENRVTTTEFPKTLPQGITEDTTENNKEINLGTTTLKSGGNNKSNHVDSTTSTNTLHSNDSDIDPLANSPSIEHRRVQRKLTLPTTTEQQKEKLIISTLKAISKSNVSLPAVYDKPQTTKPPKPLRTTVRNVELRQYQKRPSYPKAPHKVIVDSGNGDNQYEIEINIRQTNKSPNPIESTPDYTTNYKSKPYDRYTSNYATFPSTTPLYAYYQQPPSQVSQSIAHNQRTKPPTVIFLNEHDEYASGTTTRQPGFVHSIVGWNSGGQRPSQADLNPNDRPGYDGVLSRPHSGAVLPPTLQNSRPGAVSSFSQAQLNGGIVQASSQAVSNGQYGSITGFASANGADSTFSFNIRPKPDKTQLNRPEGLGNYGFAQTPPKNWYNQKPDFNEQNPSYEVPHRESVPSPFSTSNSQTYYIRKKTRPQLKEGLTFYREHEIRDYDYLGRTRRPTQNITALDYTDDNEYDYDDDYGNSPLLRKFNKDGYLRPELMLGTFNKTPITDLPQPTANHSLDDNYVLPVMNSTKDIPKGFTTVDFLNVSSEFPDSQGKQLNSDIFAEDLQDPEDSTDDDSLEDDETATLLELQHRRTNILKRQQEKIAFAPITVLTKPERPDNWVIYDSPKEEEPLLPLPDHLNTDLSPSAEIPKPIRENIWLSLANIKRKLSSDSSKDTTKAAAINVQSNLTMEKENSMTTTPNMTGMDAGVTSDSAIDLTEHANIESMTDSTTPGRGNIERTDAIITDSGSVTITTTLKNKKDDD